MKKLLGKLTMTLTMIFIVQSFAAAQTTGSIAGTVLDANGAVVPNAAVSILGASG